MSPPMSTPPGWYPDGNGATRYYDGTAWTEHTHDPNAPQQQPAQPAAEPAAEAEAADAGEVDAPWYQQSWFFVDLAVLIFIAAIIAYAVINNSGHKDTPPVVAPVATTPAVAPSVPGVAPSVPGVAPSVPGVAPSVPGVAPSVPGVVPSVPGVAPSVTP